eukprot:gene1343-388_t
MVKLYDEEVVWFDDRRGVMYVLARGNPGGIIRLTYHTALSARKTLFEILKREDDATTLREFIEKDLVGVNEGITHDVSAVTIAAAMGHENCIRYLLARSDCCFNRSPTPLYEAVLREEDEMAETLASDPRVAFSVRHHICSETAGGLALQKSIQSCVRALLRGEKKRHRTYDHCLMHVATRKQPQKNELVHVFKDFVRPYLLESAFTPEQHEQIAGMNIL